MISGGRGSEQDNAADGGRDDIPSYETRSSPGGSPSRIQSPFVRLLIGFDSRQNIVHDFAFDVREAKAPAVVEKSQSLVIEAQKMKDRCVQVVN